MKRIEREEIGAKEKDGEEARDATQLYKLQVKEGKRERGGGKKVTRGMKGDLDGHEGGMRTRVA